MQKLFQGAAGSGTSGGLPSLDITGTTNGADRYSSTADKFAQKAPDGAWEPITGDTGTHLSNPKPTPGLDGDKTTMPVHGPTPDFGGDMTTMPIHKPIPGADGDMTTMPVHGPTPDFGGDLTTMPIHKPIPRADGDSTFKPGRGPAPDKFDDTHWMKPLEVPVTQIPEGKSGLAPGQAPWQLYPHQFLYQGEKADLDEPEQRYSRYRD
jgi:hypothetical protein